MTLNQNEWFIHVPQANLGSFWLEYVSKDLWCTGAFLLKLKISVVAVQTVVVFNEDFLCGDDFEAVLAIFFCYDYGPNASEAV